MNGSSAGPTNVSSTAVRALAVLDVLVAEPSGLRLKDVAARVGLDKATTLRLLGSLQHAGLAIQNGTGGSYRPSLKLVQMASRVLESYDFRGVARAHVQALAREVGHAVFAGVLEGAEVFYVEHAEGDAELRVHRRIGDRRSIHTSSIGKAIVAFLPQPERVAVVRACRFERRTAHTIADRAAYLEHLEEVRRRGWALVRDEDSVGAASVSAPVFDHGGQVVGAIGISVPSVMLVDETLERSVRLLRETCAAASAELGYRGGEGATQAG